MGYQSVTFGDLKAQLATRWESVPFFSDTEAGLAINEALKTFNMLTGRWKQRIILETTPMMREVALPSPILYRTRVAWNGQPLSPSARTDFNLGRPRWREESTASGGSVPSKVMLWAPVSLGLIYLWPADAVGHNSLTIDGVANTPVLTLDADFVDLSEADLAVLVNFALHVALLKKGGPWWQASFPYFQAFLLHCAAENALLTTSQAYRRFMGLDQRPLKPLRIDAPTPASAGGPS